MFFEDEMNTGAGEEASEEKGEEAEGEEGEADAA